MIAAAASRKRKRPFGKHAWLSVLGGLVMALAMTGVVDAYWTAGGTGSGSGPVGTLGAPTSLSGTAGAGTATLTWDRVTPPGGGAVNPPGSPAVSYYVQRTPGTPAVDCPTSASPASVLKCTDSGLSKGDYSYTVTAVWKSWTATSDSLTVTLVSGAASKLAFTQSPGDTVAGVVFASQPQVTVQDQYGNTVTGDASTVTLASSGPGSLTGCSQSESSGVITFSGCTITTVGSGYRLHATDGTLTPADSTAFTISASATASKLAFTQSPGDTVAGVVFASQPQVTVQDQYGNTVTTDASSVTISVTGGTPAVTCIGNSMPASGGIATFSGCTITKAGTDYTLTATDGSLTATSGSFTVSASTTASKLAFTQSPTGTTVAGVAFASQPQVTVQDQFGNTVTGDTSNVTISVTSGTATVTGCANTKAASGGIATFSGCTITKAGTDYTLTATDGSLTATSGSFTISASATASKLAFTQSPTGTTVAGVVFASQPQVTVQDQYGNTVTTDASSVTIAVTGGTPAVTCTANTNPQTASGGIVTFSGCTITKAGTYTLTATDGTLTSATTGTFTISAAAEAGIVLSSITTILDPLVACFGSIDAVTCVSAGGKNDGYYTLTAKLTRVDQFGNAVANNTGSPIGIALGVSGQGTVTTPGTNPLSIPISILNGVPGETSASFTLIRDHPGNSTVTMTATVLGTPSQTLTVTLSFKS